MHVLKTVEKNAENNTHTDHVNYKFQKGRHFNYKFVMYNNSLILPLLPPPA